jgi:hypothetical protein
MREKVAILFDAGRMPSGDQIFDLLLEDQITSYIWYRAIDGVLWRQSHGKPVKVLADPDHDSAAIDARYDAAREFASDANCTPYTTETDVHLLCEEQIIKGWERTDAELKEDTDLMIEVLKVRTAPAFAELKQSDYRRGWDDGLRAVFELARRRREKGAA